MAPYINGFIMEHEKRFPDLSVTIEVDSVAILDVLVINKVVRGIFDMANECLQFDLTEMSYFLEFVEVFIRDVHDAFNKIGVLMLRRKLFLLWQLFFFLFFFLFLVLNQSICQFLNGRVLFLSYYTTS